MSSDDRLESQSDLNTYALIDAEGLFNPDNANNLPSLELSRKIIEACKEWGFFMITNHGFSPSLLEEMTDGMHRFFDMTLEEKIKVERTETNPMGYSNNELTKQKLDLKELFDFCYVPKPELPADHELNRTIDGTNRWPSETYPEFETVMLKYFNECSRCAFKLLEAFCIGLGLDPNSLHHIFQDCIGFMRLNYYEPHSTVEDHNNSSDNEPLLGIHPHSDAGFLTILIQDSVPALQMQTDGVWYLVNPVPGALTINVGDQCQVLTNGVVKAPVHRVISPTVEKRYSAPFFFNPAPNATIAPLDCFTRDTPPMYKPINWGEFRSKRFAGDYADQGTEIQISDYLI